MSPDRGSHKRLLLMAALLALAGCGGSGAPRTQTVSAARYAFEAPKGWTAARTRQSAQASSGDSAVSVTVFRLKRPYRPGLWSRVVPELDAAAASLADQLRGRIASRGTVTVARRRARRYEIAFRRSDGRFREQITFVLAGPLEYQLLCRYRAGGDARPCAALGSSFRLR
jgi:hypothetical protein